MLVHARLALVAAATFGIVAAGCREYQPEGAAPAPTPARAVTPAAEAEAAPPAVPDRSLARGVELGAPIRDGRLELVPVLAAAPAPTSGPTFLTLADGMKRGVVSVREVDGEWEVDTVKISNRSRQPLFAMSGEVILEGRQDRVVAESRVIEAGATTELKVRCVEPGREHGSRTFKPGEALGDVTLRRTVRYGTQSEVWSHVRNTNAVLALHPPNETYREAAALQRAAPAIARRDRIAAALAAQPGRERMIGVGVALDGEVIAVERFATPALYAKLEPQLLGSYVATERDGAAEGTGRTASLDDFRALARDSAIETAASVESLRPTDREPVDPSPRD